MFDKYTDIIPHIAVGSGVIDTVAGWIRDCGYKKVLTVCDPNTYRVAGERVITSLRSAGIETAEFCFPDDEPLPDETSVGRLLCAYTPDTDLILGVGSGTINDICTYVGARVACRCAIAGTAPSMDGYASLGSAMLLGGVKITPPTQCPCAIFCDTDILSEAPMHMIAAGVGDMLGKITSLADWRLSHTVTGEPMPDDICQIMENALDKVIASAAQAAKRDKKAIESLTEGLILSGIAMSLYGDSRPASGTEHHLAHFFELRTRKHELHGTKVSLGTVMALFMWKALLRKSREERDTFLHRDIINIAHGLPEPREIISILSGFAVDITPKALGLSMFDVHEAVLYAKDRKQTYTLMQHLHRLGLLGEFADLTVEYFTNNALRDVKCFVLDMDGTIYLGERLFPYTHSFLSHLKEAGLDYIFFTNNSSQNASHYIAKLKRMGIEIPDNKLLMSTHVLLDYLKEHVRSLKSVFIAGTRALIDDFINAGFIPTDENPDFCVLGFDTDMDYARLTKLCDFVRSGVPVYGVNMDYNCPVEQSAAPGGFIPDCGSLAAALETSTGVKPEFFGKPSRRALDYIIKTTGYSEDELCFIGDRLYTDIAIADGTRAGSVLVLSGETKKEDIQSAAKSTLYIPDLIVEDLRDLLPVI